MHGCALLVSCLLIFHVEGAARRNPDFTADVPKRTEVPADDPAVRAALQFVMTELKRLSNQYRYISLVKCHRAEVGAANFDGRNLFLDIELDLLKGQLSRHDVIVFQDEHRVISGLAIDEFPEVKFRERLDPDV
ncbi:hypothetical protein AB1Y20_002920 [Prymnesium parvum]|uniref:Uncharacterized protein n=1 Tax=Prymnesium parvum TaxID=97485 RepID=A0AB34JD05_PRYPA